MVNLAVKGRVRRLAQGRDLGFSKLSDDGTTVVYERSTGSEIGVYLNRGNDDIKLSNKETQRVSVSANGNEVAFMEVHPDSQQVVVRWQDGERQEIAKERAFGRPVLLSDDGETVVWEDYLSDSTGQRGRLLRWNDSQTEEIVRGEDPILSGTSGDLVYSTYDPNSRERTFWHIENGKSSKELKLEGSDAKLRALDDSGRYGVVRTYAGENGEGSYDLYIHDFKTGKSRYIAEDENLDEVIPAISGDGTTVAYIVKQPTSWDNAQIRIWRNGSTYNLLEENGFPGMDLVPGLSEDGSVICWHRSDSSGNQILKADIDWDSTEKAAALKRSQRA